MKCFNIPMSTIQAYDDWSAAFQKDILHSSQHRERDAFLRLAAFGMNRQAFTMLAAYVCAQSVRVKAYSENIYPHQVEDVRKIQASIKKAKELVIDAHTRAKGLSSAPGLWRQYGRKVEWDTKAVQDSLARIKLHGVRQRTERNELFAAISQSTMRAALTFAGVRLKKKKINKKEIQKEEVQEGKIQKEEITRFARCAGWLFQRVFGKVTAQEAQPVIAWICVAQRASDVKVSRTEKALRDEVDRRKVSTPLWEQIADHVVRMWGFQAKRSEPVHISARHVRRNLINGRRTMHPVSLKRRTRKIRESKAN
jgi:hypothetical protein